MSDAVVTSFSAWESFYVIVGSSGAALTGLQFVVMALIADLDRRGGPDTINAFGTPTVVHFCFVLGTAGLLSAPWENVSTPAIILALAGLLGLFYAGVVTVRAARQKEYRPVWEDWLWHSILPAVAYLILTVGALTFWHSHRNGLFMVATTSMMLLFIGIHNAWDSVAYITTELAKQQPATKV
jgi:hypothetical protein